MRQKALHVDTKSWTFDPLHPRIGMAIPGRRGLSNLKYVSTLTALGARNLSNLAVDGGRQPAVSRARFRRVRYTPVVRDPASSEQPCARRYRVRRPGCRIVADGVTFRKVEVHHE